MQCKEKWCIHSTSYDDGPGYPDNIVCDVCARWHDAGEQFECPCPEQFELTPPSVFGLIGDDIPIVHELVDVIKTLQEQIKKGKAV